MAWSKVQSFAVSTEFNVTTHASTQVTLGSAVAVGDTLLVWTTQSGDPSVVGSGSVTDQLGNTYTLVTAAQGGAKYDSVNVDDCNLFWCIVTAAGTPTVKYTPGTAPRNWLGINGGHFTGSDASSTRRDSQGQLQTNPGTGTDAISSTSVSAAQNGDLLGAGGGYPGSQVGTTEVIGTGFSAGGGPDATTSLMYEWKTASGAGAGTFTDATNGGGNVYMTIAIAISPASAVATVSGAGYYLHKKRWSMVS